MDNKRKYTDQYRGYLADYEETQDVTSLVKLYNMIAGGKIKLTAVDSESLGFLPKNRGNGKCSRCKCDVFKDQPIFMQFKKGICTNCPSAQEKAECTYYQNYIRSQVKTPNIIEPTTAEEDNSI